MKTTVLRAIIARNELTKLGKKEVDFKSSLALAQLQKKLGEVIEVFDGEKLKLAESMGGKVDAETGQFNFADPDKHAEFIAKIQDKSKEEIEIDAKPIDISAFNPNANTILQVMDFIKIEEE